jgi:hypothetical protein
MVVEPLCTKVCQWALKNAPHPIPQNTCKCLK